MLLAQRYYVTSGYKLEDKELRKQLKRDRVAGLGFFGAEMVFSVGWC